MLQEGNLRLDRMLDGLQLIVDHVHILGELLAHRVAKVRNAHVAIGTVPAREAVEDDAVLEVEGARLVGDAEDEDGACLHVRERQGVHEARVGVVVVRRDDHAPGRVGRDATRREQLVAQLPALAFVDAPDHCVHLLRAVREADRIGDASRHATFSIAFSS
jgi:hypothetical protein